LGGLQAEGEFEVFDSSGGWEFLFGKLLLHCFKAVHDFNADTVTVWTAQGSMALCNNVKLVKVTPMGASPAHNAKQQENSVGGSSSMNPPLRQVLHTNILEPLVQNDESGFITDHIEVTTEGASYGIEELNEDVEREGEHVEESVAEQDNRVQGEEQGTNQGGGEMPPSREVLNHSAASEGVRETDNLLVAAAEYTMIPRRRTNGQKR